VSNHSANSISADSQELTQKGFVRKQGVFSQEQIVELRKNLDMIFSEPPKHTGDFDNRGNFGSIRIDMCARNEQLSWLLVHPPLLTTLRSLLGSDFVFLPEMAAHRNGFGSWHKDTTSQERAGHTFHKAADFKILQVAVYLQDNGIYGGGLDVIPGSHTKSDSSLGQTLQPLGAESIPSLAGDLLCFDMRLDHKASWPTTEAKPVPTKYALFFLASVNNRYARDYCDYIQSRNDYAYLKDHQYPEELLSLTRSQNVTLMLPAHQTH